MQVPKVTLQDPAAAEPDQASASDPVSVMMRTSSGQSEHQPDEHQPIGQGLRAPAALTSTAAAAGEGPTASNTTAMQTQHGHLQNQQVNAGTAPMQAQHGLLQNQEANAGMSGSSSAAGSEAGPMISSYSGRAAWASTTNLPPGNYHVIIIRT